MSSVRKWLGISLEALGGAALLCALLMAAALGWYAWQMSPYSEKVDSITPREAKMILKWGELEKEVRIKRVLTSRVSRRSFTGDHADFYTLQLEHFPAPSAVDRSKWHTGPLTDPTLKKAVDFSMAWADQPEHFFPASREDLPRRPYLFSFPWINLSGQRVTAAIVMVYDPQTRRLYVVDSKT